MLDRNVARGYALTPPPSWSLNSALRHTICDTLRLNFTFAKSLAKSPFCRPSDLGSFPLSQFGAELGSPRRLSQLATLSADGTMEAASDVLRLPRLLRRAGCQAADRAAHSSGELAEQPEWSARAL